VRPPSCRSSVRLDGAAIFFRHALEEADFLKIKIEIVGDVGFPLQTHGAQSDKNCHSVHKSHFVLGGGAPVSSLQIAVRLVSHSDAAELMKVVESAKCHRARLDAMWRVSC
jgi:hypothetical protein